MNAIWPVDSGLHALTILPLWVSAESTGHPLTIHPASPYIPPPLSCHHGDMDTRRELQQALWEVIAEMERARLQGDDDQARRLEGIGWRLVGEIH